MTRRPDGRRSSCRCSTPPSSTWRCRASARASTLDGDPRVDDLRLRARVRAHPDPRRSGRRPLRSQVGVRCGSLVVHRREPGARSGSGQHPADRGARVQGVGGGIFFPAVTAIHPAAVHRPLPSARPSAMLGAVLGVSCRPRPGRRRPASSSFRGGDSGGARLLRQPADRCRRSSLAAIVLLDGTREGSHGRPMSISSASGCSPGLVAILVPLIEGQTRAGRSGPTSTSWVVSCCSCSSRSGSVARRALDRIPSCRRTCSPIRRSPAGSSSPPSTSRRSPASSSSSPSSGRRDSAHPRSTRGS